MKIKFLFGLIFVLSAFVMQAQYVGPNQAMLILNSEATALENGTTDIKAFSSTANVATTGSTLTGLSNNSTGDISITQISGSIYPAIMFQTAKEIEMAGNTVTGVQNAEALFTGMTTEDSRMKVIEAAFAYIKDLISI